MSGRASRSRGDDADEDRDGHEKERGDRATKDRKRGCLIHPNTTLVEPAVCLQCRVRDRALLIHTHTLSKVDSDPSLACLAQTCCPSIGYGDTRSSLTQQARRGSRLAMGPGSVGRPLVSTRAVRHTHMHALSQSPRQAAQYLHSAGAPATRDSPS